VRLTPDLIAEHEQLARRGVPIAKACRQLKTSERSYYRWAKQAEAGENGSVREFYERVVLVRRTGGAVRADIPADWRSIELFREWSAGLILDSGKPWVVEPFQLAAVADVLAGYEAVWLVVPEGNGKTTLAAGLGLFHLDHVEAAEVPVAAATVQQANTLYRQCEEFVARTPGMAERFRCVPGMRRIDALETRGHLRVYPGTDATADGVIPSLGLLDELHRHKNLRLLRVWRGKYGKRQGPIVVISTAGAPSSEFEELRQKIIREAPNVERNGAHIRAEHPTVVLHDWAVRDREQIEDVAAVAEANPLSTVTERTLAAKRAGPEMTPAHWSRFTANVAAAEEGAAVLPEVWDALAEPGVQVSPAAWSIGWLDLGWQVDCSALGVLVWEGWERRVVAGVRILEPPVDEADVVAGILNLQRELAPIGWAFDPNSGGQQMAQLLAKGEHPQQRGGESIRFFEHPQTNGAMALAAARFDEAVRNGWLVHDGHEGLRPLGGEQWKYDRPPDARHGERRGKFPNDALIGAVMGHSVAVAEHDAPEPVYGRAKW
jgi:hypothetical protein